MHIYRRSNSLNTRPSTRATSLSSSDTPKYVLGTTSGLSVLARTEFTQNHHALAVGTEAFLPLKKRNVVASFSNHLSWESDTRDDEDTPMEDAFKLDRESNDQRDAIEETSGADFDSCIESQFPWDELKAELVELPPLEDAMPYDELEANLGAHSPLEDAMDLTSVKEAYTGSIDTRNYSTATRPSIEFESSEAVFPDQVVSNAAVKLETVGPYASIDTPGVSDVAWSPLGTIAVVTRNAVLLNGVDLLMAVSDTERISSIKWCETPGRPNILAIGSSANVVHMYDCEAMKKVRTLTGHTGSISSLAWGQNVLSSGGSDAWILNHDDRAMQHVVSRYKRHHDTVASLAWNEDGSCLASGGNDSLICLWDASRSGESTGCFSYSPSDASIHLPRLVLDEQNSSVRALEWCRNERGILASSSNRQCTINFWDSSSGDYVGWFRTPTPATSIIWSNLDNRKFASSHGSSTKQVAVWNFHTMSLIKHLGGHSAPVNRIAFGPNGSSIVSAGVDGKVCLWNDVV